MLKENIWPPQRPALTKRTVEFLLFVYIKVQFSTYSKKYYHVSPTTQMGMGYKNKYSEFGDILRFQSSRRP